MKTLKFLGILLLASISLAHAGGIKDLSGKYTCDGKDDKDGVFHGAIDTLVLNKSQNNKMNSYTFTIENYGNLTYSGFAISDGENMAIYFTNTDTSTPINKSDYSLALAKFTANGFKVMNYQPTYKGGDSAYVTCIKINSKHN